MQLKSLMLGAALAALASGAAHAAVVLSDNFDAENGGVSQTNYTGFANFDVTSGAVDLIAPGNSWGLTGAGSFVDLDGSAFAAGTITSKAAYSYSAGDLVTLTFDISGNERGCCDQNDQWFAGFNFAGPTSVNHWTVDGSDAGTLSIPGGTANFTNGFGLPQGTLWGPHTVSFVATSAGTVNPFFGTYSNDNVGPLLDNVSLSIGAVPEPGTWAMMLIGVGMAGAGLRAARRRQAGALAA
jgi:hypothetical protein